VLVYPDADKLGRQIKYADGPRIPYVAILGGDEVAAGTVTIKNLAAKPNAPTSRPRLARPSARN
jgi:histidyl-tRNA synthetase